MRGRPLRILGQAMAAAVALFGVVAMALIAVEAMQPIAGVPTLSWMLFGTAGGLLVLLVVGEGLAERVDSRSPSGGGPGRLVAMAAAEAFALAGTMLALLLGSMAWAAAIAATGIVTILRLLPSLDGAG